MFIFVLFLRQKLQKKNTQSIYTNTLYFYTTEQEGFVPFHKFTQSPQRETRILLLQENRKRRRTAFDLV